MAFQVKRADQTIYERLDVQLTTLFILSFLSGVVFPLIMGLLTTSDPQEGDFYGVRGVGGVMCTFWAAALVVSCVGFFSLFPRWKPHLLAFLLPALSSLGFIVTLGILNPTFFEVDYFITFLMPGVHDHSFAAEIFYILIYSLFLGAFFVFSPFVAVWLLFMEFFFDGITEMGLLRVPFTLMLSFSYLYPTSRSIKNASLVHPPDWVFRPLVILLALGYVAYLYVSWGTVITA